MTQHINPEHTLEILGDTLPRKVGMSPETLAMASKLSLAIGWMDARLPYSSAGLPHLYIFYLPCRPGPALALAGRPGALAP